MARQVVIRRRSRWRRGGRACVNEIWGGKWATCVVRRLHLLDGDERPSRQLFRSVLSTFTVDIQRPTLLHPRRQWKRDDVGAWLRSVPVRIHRGDVLLAIYSLNSNDRLFFIQFSQRG